MPLSVCILINQWHPKLLETLNSYNECWAEILLGANGDFLPDEYPELKKLNHIKCVRLDWKGYGATKNQLASLAQNDWILSVDTDEVADLLLQKSLKSINLNKPTIVYALKMCHYLGERPVLHGAWSVGKRNFLRLYNRKHTYWNEAAVHESIVLQPDSEIVKLSGRINHYTALNYQQFLAKSRKYAELSARKYREMNKPVFWGKSWLSALFSFVKNYIFRLGFLDGIAGWQIAKGTALYTFWKYHLLQKGKCK